MAKARHSLLEQLAAGENPNWKNIIGILHSYVFNGTSISSEKVIKVIKIGLKRNVFSLWQLERIRHWFGTGICQQAEMQRTELAKEYRIVFDYLGKQVERQTYHPYAKNLSKNL
jgi:hypothetical protein